MEAVARVAAARVVAAPVKGVVVTAAAELAAAELAVAARARAAARVWAIEAASTEVVRWGAVRGAAARAAKAAVALVVADRASAMAAAEVTTASARAAAAVVAMAAAWAAGAMAVATRAGLLAGVRAAGRECVKRCQSRRIGTPYLGRRRYIRGGRADPPSCWPRTGCRSSMARWAPRIRRPRRVGGVGSAVANVAVAGAWEAAARATAGKVAELAAEPAVAATGRSSRCCSATRGSPVVPAACSPWSAP